MSNITEGRSTKGLSPNARARVLVEMEPHWFPSLYRTPLLTTTCRRVYVLVNEDEPGMGVVSHDHRAPYADRWGDAVCDCGARLWSPWWVADGIHGHGTAEWIRQQETTLIHRSMKRIEVSQ